MVEHQGQLRLCEVSDGVPVAGASVSSLADLFRGYSGYVASIAFRILGRDGDVDDVVQDVFIDAMGGLAGLRDPGAVKGWLRTVTVRCASRRLRRRRLMGYIGLDEAVDYQKSLSGAITGEQRVMLGKVYGILDRMAVKERVAWTLRYMEEESLEDVARLCDCSLATAKRRISAAQSGIERGFNHENG